MVKVIELFSGIGAPRKALENLKINHSVIAFSEIDKYAETSYRAIFNDYVTPNLGDITKISELPECDLLTYGFPCQDISTAGRGEGIKKGTRSGLLLEVKRLLNVAAYKNKLPRILILENVKALIQKKHKSDFDSWLQDLERLGYKNYYQILSAKDYGIPQSRERVFVISILGNHKPYIFPKASELKIKLSDLLESEVDEKYYLKDEKVKEYIMNLKQKDISYLTDEINRSQEKRKLILPVVSPNRVNKNQNGRRIKNNDEPMFTLTTLDRHGIVIIDKEISNCVTANFGKGATLKGYFEKAQKQLVLVEDIRLRIRYITPLECWRLMGFDDRSYYKAKEALQEKFYKGKDKANSQQYKQAGNSIVVPVFEAIIRELFNKRAVIKNTKKKQMKFIPLKLPGFGA